MRRLAALCLVLAACSESNDASSAQDAGATDAATAEDATHVLDATERDATVADDAAAAEDAAIDDARVDAPLSPSALCLVDRMTSLYPGFLPTSPYANQPDATECVASAHDVIMVLGCPSEADGSPARCQTDRADLAVAMSEHGYSDWFIVSGAAVHNEHVEADALAQLLMERGVPADHIVLEPEAEHTDENLYYSSRIMQARGWTTAIVVSDDPGHLIMSAVCDANCCVKLGRLTVFDFPVGRRTRVAGHYVLVPPGMEVLTAECDQIEQPTKAMCVNLSSRLACADDFRLDD